MRPTRNNSSPEKWLAERQQALADKQQRTTELLQRKPASKPVTKPEPAQPRVSTPRVNPMAATIVPPLAHMAMQLLEDDGVTRLEPVQAIEQIAGYMDQARRDPAGSVLLLWPGSTRSLALAHAVATAASWQRGDKTGIRTLLYPAKRNFLHALNHTHIHREQLLRLARRLCENPGTKNPDVIASLRDKDPFWFSLNGIDGAPGEEIHPSFAELIPHFFADAGFSSWKACDGALLRHVRRRLKDRSHRHSLGDLTIPTLSNPETAPDALFAIGWNASPKDVRAALKKLRLGRRPDVIIIDGTRAMRRDNGGWTKQIVRFLHFAYEAWPTDGPSLLVAVDEPHVWRQVVTEIEKQTKKHPELDRFVTPGVPQRGILCSSAPGSELRPAEQPELLPNTKPDFQVSITDHEAAKLLSAIDKLRLVVTDKDWLDALKETSAYLSRLAALPSSTRALVNWLNEADVPMAVRSNYSWPAYQSRLQLILNDPRFDERERLREILAKGTELWMNYANGTPLARKLADLIEEHTRGKERCCIAFTRPTARRLAERYFETYDGYPEGAGFEVLRDHVLFSLSRNLSNSGELDRRETIIFAGLDEESLRLLLLDDRLSSPTYILLTARNASYLRATLLAVSKLTEFSCLRPRIDSLLRQLPETSATRSGSILRREDFVLPTFSFEAGLSTTISDSEDDDPNAWEFGLESGLILRRSPGTSIYVYEPALSHTPTKGFVPKKVKDLQEGDRVFIMSVELRELTESAFREGGLPISSDKRFESDLREYHAKIAELVDAVLPGRPMTDKAEEVYGRMQKLDRGAAGMPVESTVKAWMDVNRHKNRTFEDARPGAPQQEAHFNAFSKAIGLSEFEAVYYWKAVIQPLRGVRRADGRRITDVYTDLLLDPQSVIVHKGLAPSVAAMLFARARENVQMIESIKRPEGATND